MSVAMHEGIGHLVDDEFLTRHWRNRPRLLGRIAVDDLETILDDVLTELDGQPIDPSDAAVRVLYEQISIEKHNFTTACGNSETIRLSEEKLRVLVTEGYTININNVARFCERIRHADAWLQKTLQKPVRTNLYHVEGTLNGLKPHYDLHDVFVVQTNGRKRWRLSGWVDTAAGDGAPSSPAQAPANWDIDVILEAGDVLYVPTGCWHFVVPVGTKSTHLTIGVHVIHPFLQIAKT
jgi:ribosomal protein L16 Arg81 hydroxylase